jgi:hypothetical protein
MDWRSQRGVEDRQQMEGAIVVLRTGAVTRYEWQERETGDRSAGDGVQPPVGKTAAEFWGGLRRDVIQDIKREIGELRRKQASP